MKTTNNITTEIVINAPAERVWDILSNFSAYEHWNPFIVKIEGQLQKGAKLKTTLQNGKDTISFKPEIQSIIPGKYFSWKGQLFLPGIFDGHHYFEIQPLNEVQIKLIHGENFSGLLASVIFKKIGNDTRNNFIRMNQSLKKLAENNSII